MKWPDMIQIIARQYGVHYSDDDVQALSYEDKSGWLRCNPVTAARDFQYRLNVEYGIRIEFQSRGSPHAHCVLWIKDAPKYGIAMNADVCDFIHVLKSVS